MPNDLDLEAEAIEIELELRRGEQGAQAAPAPKPEPFDWDATIGSVMSATDRKDPVLENEVRPTVGTALGPVGSAGRSYLRDSQGAVIDPSTKDLVEPVLAGAAYPFVATADYVNELLGNVDEQMSVEDKWQLAKDVDMYKESHIDLAQYMAQQGAAPASLKDRREAKATIGESYRKHPLVRYASPLATSEGAWAVYDIAKVGIGGVKLFKAKVWPKIAIEIERGLGKAPRLAASERRALNALVKNGGVVPEARVAQTVSALEKIGVKAEPPIGAQGGIAEASKGPAPLGTGDMVTEFPYRKTLEKTADVSEPITKEAIIDKMARSVDRPIRVGRIAQKNAAGIYKVRSTKMARAGKPGTQEVVRLLKRGDFTTASHEMAHVLERQYHRALGRMADESNKTVANARRAWAKDMGESVTDELRMLDYDVIGGKLAAEEGRIHEGFAEWMRHYMTLGDEHVVAPEFTRWFEHSFAKPNKKWVDDIDEIRALIGDYGKQGGVNRIFAQIDSLSDVPKGPLLERAQERWVRFRTLWEDDKLPIELAERELTGGKLRYGAESPTLWARRGGPLAHAHARRMVHEGMCSMTGEIYGPSLKEIAHPVRKNYRDAIGYAVAKHGEEMIAKGKNPGFSLDDAQQAIKELFTPEREKFSRQIAEWNDGLLNYLVESGAIDDTRPVFTRILESGEELLLTEADLIRESYDWYLPMRRVFEDGPGLLRGGGRKMGDLAPAIMRQKGSGRRLVDPFEAMVGQAQQVTMTGQKTAFANAFMDMVEEGVAAGRIAEGDLPWKVVGTDFKIGDIVKQLESLGIEVPRETTSMDAVLTVFSNTAKSSPRENIVTFVRNGKRTMVQLDHELYRAMQAVDVKHMPVWADVMFGAPTRALRLGTTGVQAGFNLIWNPLKDFRTLLMQSRYNAPKAFLAYWRGMGRAMKGAGSTAAGKALEAVGRLDEANAVRRILGDEVHDIFRASGGELSQFLGMDRKLMRKIAPTKRHQNIVQRAWDFSTDRVDDMRSALSVPEEFPRLAEVEMRLRQTGWKPGTWPDMSQVLEGGFAGAESTVDFSRRGAFGGFVNQIYPYFNANAQGLSKFARTVKQRPLYTLGVGIGTITIPGLYKWWLVKDNEDYKRKEGSEKWSNTWIPTSEGLVRDPLPFEWGIFDTAPRAAAEYWYRRDPKVFKEMAGAWFEQNLPVPGASGLMRGDTFGEKMELAGLGVLPQALKPGVEAIANKREYSGVPLESRGMQSVSPEHRARQWTSEASRQLGEQFGVSPIKIDHLIRGYFGGVGSDVVKHAVDPLIGIATGDSQRDQRPRSPHEWFIIGRLFNNVTPSRWISAFYTELGHLETMDANRRGGYEDTKPDKRTLRMMRTANRNLRELRRKREDAASYAEIRRLTLEMDKVAKKALGIEDNIRPSVKRTTKKIDEMLSEIGLR